MEKAAENTQQPAAETAPGESSVPAPESADASGRNPEQQMSDTALAGEAANTDLDAPELYLNRELTWLEFNRRVLHMAGDPEVPLLARAKYLAIVSNNLDELFMKRIGRRKRPIVSRIRTPTVDGRSTG